MIALAISLLLTGSPVSTPVQMDKMRPVAASLSSSTSTEGVSEMPAAVRVTLRCTAYGDGHVGGCTVLDETRPGMGFGRAAVVLMEMSQVEPDQHDGKPVDVTFEHTIEFTP
jgi:hypothetical protein